jgi:DNA-binding transcriptional LysR family regulator
MEFKRSQLRYFLTVAEEGQITRAAAKLHIAQPALTQAIRQLESELGVELLERHARGVTLTAAGEVFLPKVRAAVAMEHEAALSARSLSRSAEGVIEIGFIGPPPPMSAPALFAAFAEESPNAEVSFRDLPFPSGATASWLEETDLAFCHCPELEAGVCAHLVRLEPRTVVMRRSHPLAGRRELLVAEILDQTFVSYHADVQPAWAGFHSLDDHRGGPPSSVTPDDAVTSLQMLGIMATTSAITTVPFCDATLAVQALPELIAVPIADARPAELSLLWREDNPNLLIAPLIALARHSAGAGSD